MNKETERKNMFDVILPPGEIALHEFFNCIGFEAAMECVPARRILELEHSLAMARCGLDENSFKLETPFILKLCKMNWEEEYSSNVYIDHPRNFCFRIFYISSRHKDAEKALQQAIDYMNELKRKNDPVYLKVLEYYTSGQ